MSVGITVMVEDQIAEIVLSLPSSVPTRLGADFTARDVKTRQYLSPDGWQQDPHLFAAEILPGGKLISRVPIEHLPEPGSKLDLNIPTAKFNDTVNWPTSVAKAPEASPVADTPENQEAVSLAGPNVTPQQDGQDVARKPVQWHVPAAVAGVLLLLATAALGWQFYDLAGQRERLQLTTDAQTSQRKGLEGTAAELARQKQLNDQAAKDLQDQRAALSGERRTLEADRANLKRGLEQLAADRKTFEDQRIAAKPSLPTPGPEQRTSESAPTAGPPPNAIMEECDRLAGNPFDQFKSPAHDGVPYTKLDSAAALAACERAFAAFPNIPRISYQLARARQRTDPVPAMAAFERLARDEYPAAYDNLGWMHYNKQDYVRAADSFRRGMALNDSSSMVSLSILIAQRPGTERDQHERYRLLAGAADLKNGQAKEILAKTPDEDFQRLPRQLQNAIISARAPPNVR